MFCKDAHQAQECRVTFVDEDRNTDFTEMVA